MKIKTPLCIPCGRAWANGHVQGIAVDEERGHVYYSFTTVLVKADLEGNLLGTVGHLAGHMGCITLDPARRRLYGSLELKHDVIGRGVMRSNRDWDPSEEDSFYLVSFDIDRIDREGMDAEADGVMKAVYLPDVVRDYKGVEEVGGWPHRYGCSGIDGVGLGPVFGADPASPHRLMVAYGVYSDLGREDNDYQVILQYDPDMVDVYGRPLDQSAPHHSGPDCEQRYFLYTGNTNYGIQNLEYDRYTGNWIVAVYPGKKPGFPNYPMYLIDGRIPARTQPLRGRGGETGAVLTLAPGPESQGEVTGCRFPFGQTGVYAYGDGTYHFSQQAYDREKGLFSTTLVKYRYSPKSPLLFEKL